MNLKAISMKSEMKRPDICIHINSQEVFVLFACDFPLIIFKIKPPFLGHVKRPARERN